MELCRTLKLRSRGAQAASGGFKHMPTAITEPRLQKRLTVSRHKPNFTTDPEAWVAVKRCLKGCASEASD